MIQTSHKSGDIETVVCEGTSSSGIKVEMSNISAMLKEKNISYKNKQRPAEKVAGPQSMTPLNGWTHCMSLKSMASFW